MASARPAGLAAAAEFTRGVKWLIAFACCAGSLFGYNTGVVAGALVMINVEIPLDTGQQEFVVSSTVLVAAFSALLSIPLNSHFGRRPVLVVSGIMFIGGAILVAVAGTFPGLLLGRMILGIAVGLSSVTTPMFAAELAPRHVRGIIVVMHDFSIVLGQLVAGLVNGLVLSIHSNGRWRWSMGLAVVPGVIELLLLLPLPESPRWLVRMKREDEAEAAMDAMERDHLVVEKDLAEIKNELHAEEQEVSKVASVLGNTSNLEKSYDHNECAASLFALWSRRSLQRASLLGVMMMALNQLSGINTVMYYSTTVLKKAGFADDHSIWLTVLCDAAQLLGVVISIISVDRVGRRLTMLRSCICVLFFLVALAVLFPLGSFNGQQALLLIALMGYLISFGAGLSGVPWVLISEIFPSRQRALGVGMCTFANWMSNFAVSESFLSLSDGIGTGGTFGLYAGVAATGFVLLYFFLPETMGLRLEETESLFGDAYPDNVRRSLTTAQLNEKSVLVPKEEHEGKSWRCMGC